MSHYPRGATDSVVAVDALLQRVQAIFSRCGMSAEDARLLADSLVVADVRGVHSHGVAVPSGAEPPIVFDAAFSASSHGKIRVYHQKGLSIPAGWAFDDQGHPTTDTERALSGLLQPIGGFKGTGLAMISGVLSSF